MICCNPQKQNTWQQARTKAGSLEAGPGAAWISGPAVGTPTKSRAITGFRLKQPLPPWGCLRRVPARPPIRHGPLPTKNPEEPTSAGGS